MITTAVNTMAGRICRTFTLSFDPPAWLMDHA
jgi:hypothetical protein